ncbi:MAG: IS21 family transposase [Acidobacteria bacterium]|nr:IS21 family transposase [Acidobacteriota bacterium]
MLDQGVRAAILSLRAKGLGIRQIARALQISRGTVRTVLQAGTPMVPRLERVEKAEPYRDQIVDLLQGCRGNLVRVHEELVTQGVSISYPALTAFCRRHGIGHEPPAPVGHYDFQPAEEMQHDTSPHRAPIAGVEQRIETASLVLGYSRMLFFQAYPVFTRFTCKVFLTDALEYLGGAAATCMIDNTHVVVAAGTGARMVPAPEMAAFADRFSFVFRAHEKGDANRSARVERPFHFIEHNFFAGRTFADLADLNAHARVFCDKVNAARKKHLHASPRELFAAERPHLHPLPLFVPEVYALHHRLVDVEGFVNVPGHRYSVPYLLIGRQLEVRETKDRIDVYHGPRLVASHAKVLGRTFTRVTMPEHRPPRGARPSTQPLPEEQTLAQADPPVPAYAVALKQRSAGRGTLALRRLLALYREYPRTPFLRAVTLAAQYGLFDLDRLERLTLRVIAKEYFLLSEEDDEPRS